MSCLNRLGSCTCSLLQYPNYSGCVNLIFVRFRKPRWLPKAPSKIFKVREPTPIDPVEYEKMKEWTTHYNTAKKSVLKYLLKHNHEMINRDRERTIKATLTFEEVYRQMEAKNAAWNEATAKIREADVAAKFEVDAVRKQKIAERDAREIEEIRQQARLKVLDAEEWKENYITEANIDDVIEEVLNSRADYEFALTPDGTTTSQSSDTEQSKT